MSYNSKLLQTGRKVASARRKYYGSFDYGSGIDAKLKGGTFSFGKKFWGGGDTWYDGKDADMFKEKFLNDTEAKNSNTKGSGTKWSGLMDVGLGFVNDIFSEAENMSDKSKSLMSMTSSYGNNIFNGINDNSGLLAALQNNGPLSGVSASNIRSNTVGQDVMSALSTGINAGMSTGNVWVGIGAAALDAGKSVLQRLQAQNYADRINQYIKDKNIRLNQDAFMTGESVDAHNDWMRIMGYYMNPYDYAFGGPLHSNGGDYNGGLTYINEGGRHEENPYEGVPSGFDKEGNPNLVEEGEVIWNNEYVFSDRLKVPKELANRYKLGGKKDYTFAEAIERLTKENNISPNDLITIATTKEIVNEFMDAQEELREKNQLAAKEELETAQAQDFLAQLDAAQGMAPSMEAPMTLPQMGALPNEAPITEGEMTPPGYAFGGNKFDNGGNKLRYEGPYIYTTDGKRFMSRSLAEKWQDKIDYANHEAFAPEGEIDAGYIVDTKPRPQQPQRAATDKDFEITEVLTNSYTTDLKRRKGYKVGKQVYFDRKDAENAADRLRLEYATTLRNIPGYGKGYRLSDGTVVATKGEAKKKQKEHNKSLRTSSQQGAATGTTNSSPSKGIGTTAMTAEPPVRTTEAPAPTVEKPTVKTTDSTSTAPTSSASRPTSGSGSIGRMTTPSGETINYRRDINGKEWESAEPYQNFLSYMRGKGKDSPEAKEWMDYIQSEINNSGSRYELKDFDDWSRLAEDGKVGPVHQATLKAAEYFAKRQGSTAISPVAGPNPTIGEILGVKPESIAKVSQSPVSKSPQTPSGSGTAQEPQFNYRDTRLRYAPAVGSVMATLYGMLNRPDYSNADRIIDAAYRMGAPINIPVETIGDYRRRNPFDERYLVNMANQNRAAAARGIANTAGGNRSMDLLGNMSLAHSNQQELGEIMRQAYLANRQDDAQVAEFNRGTNLYNMNAINQRNISQAQLNTHRQQAGISGLAQGYGLRQSIKDNWDSATMESLNSTLASLGAIGKENEEYNILTSMAENGYFPYYYGDRSIMKYNPYTGEKLVKNGGKLNRKKRRF